MAALASAMSSTLSIGIDGLPFHHFSLAVQVRYQSRRSLISALWGIGKAGRCSIRCRWLIWQCDIVPTTMPDVDVTCNAPNGSPQAALASPELSGRRASKDIRDLGRACAPDDALPRDEPSPVDRLVKAHGHAHQSYVL